MIHFYLQVAENCSVCQLGQYGFIVKTHFDKTETELCFSLVSTANVFKINTNKDNVRGSTSEYLKLIRL